VAIVLGGPGLWTRTSAHFSGGRELLIHFVYARKLNKQDQGTVPASHQALDPKDYRNGLNLPDEHRERFRQLYDDLCGVCHPTAIGLATLWETLPAGTVRITAPDDRTAIKTFYEIELAVSWPVKLNGAIPLQLVALGPVLRTGETQAARPTCNPRAVALVHASFQFPVIQSPVASGSPQKSPAPVAASADSAIVTPAKLHSSQPT
jgi:hypothetical protein